jgi:hypothetical protein
MKRSALCLVDTETQADAIVSKLRSAGFSDNDISVLFPDKGSTRDFAHKKETKMPEGATVGASTGGVVGGTIGLLAGIGALAIPGLGPFIAAGPIMAALSGGAIGAVGGGLTGALIGLGIPEYEAKRYEGKVKEGGILISVHSESNDETNRCQAHGLIEHHTIFAEKVSKFCALCLRSVSPSSPFNTNGAPPSAVRRAL